MSTDSHMPPSMIHLRHKENQMAHMKTMDSKPNHGVLPKETSTISVIRTLMRKLLDSSEPTKTLLQFHTLEDKLLTQSMDGTTLHHQLFLFPRDPPRISQTKTSMRKLLDSSEPTRT
jgi:hypothetical protein